MKLHAPLRLLAALTLAAASLFAHAADLTVAYYTTVAPATVARADGSYAKATHAPLKAQGKVQAVLPDYAPYVSALFIPN